MIAGWLLTLLGGYILGSIPSGYLLVRLRVGKDVREQHSGRTGGTNVMRSAGVLAGLLTAVADVGKAALAVWIARQAFPDLAWLHVLVGAAAVIGHNYSLFMLRREDGRVVSSGGAGGAPTVGASIGLWAPAGLIVVPVGALVFYFVGYASVATMTIGVTALVIFAWRAVGGVSPWPYAIFGLLAEILILWALRPNIRRLMRGEERVVGLRAKRQDSAEERPAA